MKVFCVGFQKTGTTSMEAALQRLGFSVDTVYGRDLSFPELSSTYVERGMERAARFDAVQDMPWPLLYRELDAAYPDAKFVLTVRDEDGWWKSILGHFGGNNDVMQQLVYGEDAGAPLGNEKRYRAVYRKHNAAVRAYFADRPDKLLELDFTKTADWGPLCAFLGIDEPQEPFPYAQQRFQNPGLKRYFRRRWLRLWNWTLGTVKG